MWPLWWGPYPWGLDDFETRHDGWMMPTVRWHTMHRWCIVKWDRLTKAAPFPAACGRLPSASLHALCGSVDPSIHLQWLQCHSGMKWHLWGELSYIAWVWYSVVLAQGEKWQISRWSVEITLELTEVFLLLGMWHWCPMGGKRGNASFNTETNVKRFSKALNLWMKDLRNYNQLTVVAWHVWLTHVVRVLINWRCGIKEGVASEQTVTN